MSTAPLNLYHIPGTAKFLDALATACRSGDFPTTSHPPPDNASLAQWTLLVPTRRAARGLEEAFFAQSDAAASLLPQIRPLGDVDEDAELFQQPGYANFAASLPRPASPLERQFLLVKLIGEWAKNAGRETRLALTLRETPAQTFSVAQSLAELIDSFNSEDVELAEIITLFENADLPIHREAALDFLAIVNSRLPEEMAARNIAGPIQIRNQLIRRQAEKLINQPPLYPIIAAGSTGSIPATQNLLKVIAGLENGAVVLPGLDTHMSDQCWQALEPSHPQYGMRELLKSMGATRADVKLLPSLKVIPQQHSRSWLVSEIMRPAETTDGWISALTQNSKFLPEAIQKIHQIHCPDQQQEAIAIALIMRQTLEQDDTTVALVTPDRRLARRVRNELKRWRIVIDDSAGESLQLARPGLFMQLVLQVVLSNFAPYTIMALLNHPFTCCGLSRQALLKAARTLEITVLRSTSGWQGMAGLLRACEAAEDAINNDKYAHKLARNTSDQEWQAMRDLTHKLAEIFQPLIHASEQQDLSLPELLQSHLTAAEALCASPDGGENIIWRGDDGQACAGLFSSLSEHSDLCPRLHLNDYQAITGQLMQRTAIRPAHANQPRLMVLGLMEARLNRADITILAGLNEGVWPAISDSDPWLNRPQRQQLGLQSPERRIGLSAHDFAQGLGADQVYLTSSAKIDATPQVKSRWLLRLEALLAAKSQQTALTPDRPWLNWAQSLTISAPANPVSQPRPTPPISARPRRFSITEIDTLLNDPYAIYAKKILQLNPLPSLTEENTFIERGNLIHNGLENFSLRYPDDLPENAEQLLLDEFIKALEMARIDEALKAFWLPQCARMANWFIAQERDLRTDMASQQVETRAEHAFELAGEPYLLTGKADRIDVLHDKTLRIIDYKTGTLPAKKPDSASYSYQLSIEAYLAAQGAFANVTAASASRLAHIRLSGGEPAGEYSELTAKGEKINTEASSHFEKFCRLLERFNEPNHPYLAPHQPRNRSDRTEREREYDLLSRWREWSLHSKADRSEP